jgi:transposase InsO family protein
MVDKRKGSPRYIPHRLSETEVQAFYEVANSPRFVDKTPEQIVALLADEGIYHGSPSTLYRILRSRKALVHRRKSKKPVQQRRAQTIQVTGPNQVWAWDITWLRTDVEGMFYYAYVIIDIYDRSIVGWTIETKESDQLAQNLFSRVIRSHEVVPQFIHADNGHPMRGVTLGVFLDSLHVTRSYSRPRVSNDNAFIESWNKTLKYTVGYPDRFPSLENSRTWFATFVHWYNTEHQHSKLGYVTPQQRRTGTAEQIYAQRNHTILMAKQKHPLRCRTHKVRCYGAVPVTIVCRPLINKELS